MEPEPASLKSGSGSRARFARLIRPFITIVISISATHNSVMSRRSETWHLLLLSSHPHSSRCAVFRLRFLLNIENRGLLVYRSIESAPVWAACSNSAVAKIACLDFAFLKHRADQEI